MSTQMFPEANAVSEVSGAQKILSVRSTSSSHTMNSLSRIPHLRNRGGNDPIHRAWFPFSSKSRGVLRTAFKVPNIGSASNGLRGVADLFLRASLPHWVQFAGVAAAPSAREPPETGAADPRQPGGDHGSCRQRPRLRGTAQVSRNAWLRTVRSLNSSPVGTA